MSTVDQEIRRGKVWTASDNEELWSIDELLKTKDEAIRFAHEMDLRYVGRVRRLGIGDFSPRIMAERVIEQMGEWAYDLCGEAVDDWPDMDHAKAITPIMAMAISTVLQSERAMYQVTDIEDLADAMLKARESGGEA